MPEHPRPVLIGPRSSHFTRVVAMLALELDVPIERDTGFRLASLDPADYGGNPALRVPVLAEGDGRVFGTMPIARRIAALADARGRGVLFDEHLASDAARSYQELVVHAMGLHVQLRIGVHVTGLPADSPFFVKSRASLEGTLAHLDRHLDDVQASLSPARSTSLLELTTFCLIEHLAFRPTVDHAGLVRLHRFAAAYVQRPSARATPFVFEPPTPTEEPTP